MSVWVAMNRRHRFKELECILHRHVEHFGNILAFVFNFQRFPVVAFAFADIAGHVNVRQEVHLNLGDAITLACFATATADIETEATGLVTAGAGFLRACKQLSDRGENAGVGCRI